MKAYRGKYPEKHCQLTDYCQRAMYETDKSYREHLEKKHSEFSKRLIGLDDIDITDERQVRERMYRNIFLTMLNNDHLEVLKEAKRFLLLNESEQLSDDSYSAFCGCYFAWMDGIKIIDEHPDLVEVCRRMAKFAQKRKSIFEENENRGRKESTEYVETLMVYMDTGKNVKATTDYFSSNALSGAIDERTIRARLKKIANPYQHIDNPTHLLYKQAKFAYEYWKSKKQKMDF